MNSRGVTVVLTGCLLILAAARVRADVQTTIAESSQLGKPRYASHSLSVTVAPMHELALDLVAGRVRSGSLFSDGSFGGGAWAQVMPRLSLSLHLDRYNGEKGFTEDLKTGDFIADNAKAQQTNTATLGATVRVYGEDPRADDDAADPDADRILRTVRVSVGGSRGTLHVPVTTIGPLGRKRDTEFTQKQSGASVGLAAAITETDLGVAYRRNHYGELMPPAGMMTLNRPLLTQIVEELRTNVAQVLSEPVAYDTLVSVSELLPHDLAFYGSFDYAVLEISRGIARTSTVEVTWDVFRWLGLKAGGIWVHERKKTTPYLLAGLNLYF